MKYDPIKNVFGKAVERNTFLRMIFYKILDLMFLRTWHVKKQIKKIYKGDAKISILDAGMGFGQYTYFLANYFKNSEILAVDVKEEQVEDCKYFFNSCGYGNTTFETADLTKIDYENKFDFIVSVDVMEHIEDDRTVFNNFSKSLKQGGYILINTPSDLGGSDAHSHDAESFIEEHARNGYSKEDISEKLKASGLEITDFIYTYGKYGTISWRFGIKYPILIAGVSKIFILLLPLYYFFTLIPVLFLMWLDVNTKNEKGTGITVIAKIE